jgi:hypothetical protein
VQAKNLRHPLPQVFEDAPGRLPHPRFKPRKSPSWLRWGAQAALAAIAVIAIERQMESRKA